MTTTKEETNEETKEELKTEGVTEKAEVKAPEGDMPVLNFASFILSLSSSALMSLGVIDNPVTGKKESEPEVAKQTIDLIALLKEKTAGNLDPGESKLMDDVLGELRLWYCKVVG